MKLVSYADAAARAPVRLGVVQAGHVVDLRAAWSATRTDAPPAALDSLLALLEAGPEALEEARALAERASAEAGRPLEQVTLRAPLPVPRSVRDFYAFEQHVKAARANRGAEMIPDWYDLPVFYFSNHLAINGPYDTVTRPRACRELDFELEVACILGRGGRDIPVERAAEHIAGYCVMNDWSARDLQRKEMRMSLGPAKGKDFATTLGPWLTTPDELAACRAPRAGGGSAYDLAMTARVNGREVSRGNWKDIYFTFEEMIARASADVWLYPGDVLGSGTVGTGCLLELTRGQGPWLEPGDVVELEIERLGLVRNAVAGAT